MTRIKARSHNRHLFIWPSNAARHRHLVAYHATLEKFPQPCKCGNCNAVGLMAKPIKIPLCSGEIAVKYTGGKKATMDPGFTHITRSRTKMWREQIVQFLSVASLLPVRLTDANINIP